MSSRPRVLVIDDDMMFRNLIVSILRKDFMVSVAKDGKEGYAKAKEHTPDIAVIDVEMPEWDGLKTLKAFRENPALKDVRVIMLTGSADKETVVKAIQGGANDYVIKSTFKKIEFLNKVIRLLTIPAATALKFSKPKKTPENSTPEQSSEENQTEENNAPAPSPSEEPVAVMTAKNDNEVTEMMQDWE